MKIKVCKENAEKIQAAIDAVQSRARTRTIDADDVLSAATNVRYTLDIPAVHMNGVTAEIDKNARSFPNAYKGIPESTQFNLVFNRKGEAFLTEVSRRPVRSVCQSVVVRHTEESRAALIEARSHWAW